MTGLMQVPLRLTYLSKKLAYPLPIKGGEVLRTIQDARDFLLTLSPQQELRNHWHYACQLILEEADVKAVTWQLHRALFLDGRLDLVAFESMNRPQRRQSPKG
jgi:hypothetical protein